MNQGGKKPNSKGANLNLLFFFKQYQILLVPLGGHFLLRYKSQCRRVHAVAQAGRLWSVLEHMAKVAVGVFTADLYPFCKKGIVFMIGNVIRINRADKTWPPCA